jgi:hypothetical protein
LFSWARSYRRSRRIDHDFLGAAIFSFDTWNEDRAMGTVIGIGNWPGAKRDTRKIVRTVRSITGSANYMR